MPGLPFLVFLGSLPWQGGPTIPDVLWKLSMYVAQCHVAITVFHSTGQPLATEMEGVCVSFWCVVFVCVCACVCV